MLAYVWKAGNSAENLKATSHNFQYFSTFFILKQTRLNECLYFTLHKWCSVALGINVRNCNCNGVKCPYFARLSRFCQSASMSDIFIKCQCCIYCVALLRWLFTRISSKSGTDLKVPTVSKQPFVEKNTWKCPF